VETDLNFDSQQFEININRDLAADLHVDLSDIVDSIATMIGGSHVSNFEYAGKNYKIMLQMEAGKRTDLAVINQLYVRSARGDMIPLASLVTVEDKVNLMRRPHYDQMHSETINADLLPGYSLMDAVNYINKTAKQLLPESFAYKYTDNTAYFLESNNSMLMIFGLAIVFIYLVLAAQFESFIDPFIILLCVPFSIIGALITLHFTGGSLNLYSQIGLVTLIGLIAKHGILITEFANQLRDDGHELYDAIIGAAALRLRPILMTTAAMVLGALPLVLAQGAGAEARQQVGYVIVGGLLFGTCFSLLVVPMAYTFFAKMKARISFGLPAQAT